jgi:hypothetical protein
MASVFGPEAPVASSRAEMYCRTPNNAEGQSAEFELRFKISGPDIIAAWPTLPKPIRKAMLALID